MILGIKSTSWAMPNCCNQHDPGGRDVDAVKESIGITTNSGETTS